MMSRTEELNRLYQEAEKIPEDYTIEATRKKVKTKARLHCFAFAARNVGIACLLFLAVLAVGVNTSETFASQLADLPFLGSIAKAITWNKGYEDAIHAEYLTVVGQTAANEITDVELAYAMADDNMLVLMLQAEDTAVNGMIDLISIKDADTGAVLSPGGYTLGQLGPEAARVYEGYTMMQISWEEYCKNLELEMELITYSGEHAALSYQFSLKDKLEPKVYLVEKTVEAEGYHFTVSEVRIYPMSTEIDVHYEDLKDAEVLAMKFAVMDESGQERENMKNFITAYGDAPDVTYVLDSGYFIFEEDIHVVLKKVELRTKDTKYVTFDKETEKFYEADGTIAKDIHIVRKNETFYELAIDGSSEWSYLNGLAVVQKNGLHYMGISSLTDDRYECIFEPWLYTETDQITMIREYPDIVIYPDSEIY